MLKVAPSALLVNQHCTVSAKDKGESTVRILGCINGKVAPVHAMEAYGGVDI
jgi:V8-like Glu-specific endopeptidase